MQHIPIIPRGDTFVVSPVLIFNISCAASKMLLELVLREAEWRELSGVIFILPSRYTSLGLCRVTCD